MGGARRVGSYHPDFGGGGGASVLLEHPAVVGEEQLQAESQREDDGQPEHRAEDQRRQHGLALGAQGHVQTARGGSRTLGYYGGLFNYKPRTDQAYFSPL